MFVYFEYIDKARQRSRDIILINRLEITYFVCIGVEQNKGSVKAIPKSKQSFVGKSLTGDKC